jgi:hypothetical protein
MKAAVAIMTMLNFAAAAATAQTPPSGNADKDDITVTGKRVCRMETPIGSMMPMRVCRTKTQAKDEERATQAAVERLHELQRIQDIQRMGKCRQGADVMGCWPDQGFHVDAGTRKGAVAVDYKLSMTVLLSFAAATVQAATVSVQNPSSNSAERSDITVTGKRICRTETSIGSMMPQRVCRTKTQIKDEERATQAAVERLHELKQIQDIQQYGRCRRDANRDVTCWLGRSFLFRME